MTDEPIRIDSKSWTGLEGKPVVSTEPALVSKKGQITRLAAVFMICGAKIITAVAVSVFGRERIHKWIERVFGDEAGAIFWIMIILIGIGALVTLLFFWWKKGKRQSLSKLSDYIGPPPQR